MNGEIILSFRTIGRHLNCMIMTLCVFVYVSSREHISRTTRPIFNKFFAKFLRDTYGRVARFLSGCVAIRYVLPVLWTTSCLQIIVGNRGRHKSVYSK